MKVELITQTKKMEITQLVSSINWSGGSGQAPRKLELSVLHSKNDFYLPKIEVENGNMIRLIDDAGKEVFQGYIFFKENTSSSEELTFTAYDGLVYLVKSKTSKTFKEMTPGNIMKAVCKDYSINTGLIKDINTSISLIALDKTPYEIILLAYNNAIAKKVEDKTEQKSKEDSGDSIYETSKYFLRMENGKLNMYEKGSITVDKTLYSEYDITGSAYSEDIEDMINYVLITDEYGDKIGEEKNTEWISKYGRLQNIAKDAEEAKKMITGVKKSGNIDAIGNIQCISGNKVKILDKTSGIIGLFVIESDSHSWSNGQYSIKLTLDYKGAA